MAEETKDISLNDLGLDEDQTPAQTAAEKANVIDVVKNNDGSSIEVLKPEQTAREIAPEFVRKSKIPRPAQQTPRPKQPVTSRNKDKVEEKYTTVNINDFAKNPISKPKDPVKETHDMLGELADKNIARTKKELTAPGGRIDEAKHKYIEHNYNVLMNRARNSTSLQKHIKAVEDIIDTDARFDGITDYERKAYILFKVARDEETGISDASFGIQTVQKTGLRKSSADNMKDIGRMVEKDPDDDEYLLKDDKFIIDEGSSSAFPFKEENTEDDDIMAEEKNVQKENETNKKVSEVIKDDENINDHLEMKDTNNSSKDEINTEEISVEDLGLDNSDEEEKTKEEPVKIIEQPKENKVENNKEEEKTKQTETKSETKTEEKKEESKALLDVEEFTVKDENMMDDENNTDEDDEELQAKREQNQKDYVNDVKKILANETESLDGFEISRETIGLNTALETRVASRPLTIIWGLQYTGIAFEMSAFSGEEIIQFSTDNTDFRSLAGLRTIFSNIYRHLIIPNKPQFETWLKQTSDYDVESLFFGVYSSCFKDNNYITYECPKSTCGKIYVEKRKIEDMVVYPNKKVEERFKRILKKDTVGTQLYRTKPIPISNKYAIGFVTQSIWSNLFETAAISEENRNKYSTVVNLMPTIDRVYFIDRTNRKLRPITFGQVEGDLTKTVMRKVKGLNTIFKTFTMDERTKVYVEASKIATAFANDVIRYRVPPSVCPACGTKISETIRTPLELLFTRSQLPIVAASTQE